MNKPKKLSFKKVALDKIDLDRIIFLIKSLITELSKENEVLDKMDVKLYEKIYEEKCILLDELVIHQQLIMKKPELLEAVDQKKLEFLKNINATFDQITLQNVQKLEKVISVNKHVIGMVKKMIINQIKSESCYSKKGDYESDRNIEEKMPIFNLDSVV